MYSSVEQFMSMVKSKNANEVEFHQAVHEVADSLWSFLDKNQHYVYARVMERMI